MKFKKAISTLLAVALLFSFSIPAYADDVNIDNIIHGNESAVDRYSHSGEYGWIVECYVATTESGKLDVNKSLLDGSNAAYLGRVVFTYVNNGAPVPAMQRPVAIQTNGGGTLPQLTTQNTYSCTANKFPDPFTTGSGQLQKDFQTASDPLENFWTLLGGGKEHMAGLYAKVAAVVSQPVKDKMKAFGDNSKINPSAEGCPVEYAFVLTPLIYTRIRAGTYSSCGWNQEFWMGANEAGVLNRYSKQQAMNDVNEFIAKCAGTSLVGTPLYEAALAKLRADATKGELTWFMNMSHRQLPDSAFLEKPQFTISTPNRNA